MSKAYYYFAATLPMIQMGGKLPFTVKDFLSSAERLLSSEDYALLQALLTDQEFESKNTTASKWLEFDRQFRNALSVYRASKAKKIRLLMFGAIILKIRIFKV